MQPQWIAGDYFLNQLFILSCSTRRRPIISKPTIRRNPTGVNGVRTDARPIVISITPTIFLIFGLSANNFLKYSIILHSVLFFHDILADFVRRSSTCLRRRIPPSLKLWRAKAEAERFELSIPCGMPPFQGGGINHYPTLPVDDILHRFS